MQDTKKQIKDKKEKKKRTHPHRPALSLSRMRTPSDPHERCRVKQSVSSAPRQLDSVQVTNPAPSI